MLYKKDKKKRRSYDYLVTPKSNEHLKKNKQKGQVILARLEKNNK
ncbi:hypothetical protein EV196_102582 [Mariniflexile fucanivorans]|uniref:Uncharacterized protein n=1 Tax=Mariniflexile fucanivorans TaxID=264023 RepID=A0A4R1RNX1_9FLAO|nr:hypothetical protein [Mariniflexile fucanivorans]TCL68018.1 hypothetical protein EV196_102582 [Mariniflexile fucanivorans]